MSYKPPPYDYNPISTTPAFVPPNSATEDPELTHHNTAQAIGNADPAYGQMSVHNPTQDDVLSDTKSNVHLLAEEDKERFNYGQSQYRDGLYAILFLIHLVLFIAITIYYGSNIPSDIDSRTNSTETTNTSTSFNATTNSTSTYSITASDAAKTLSVLPVAIIVSALWSAAFLEIMKRYANSIIYFMLVVNLLLNVVGLILGFWLGSLAGGIIYACVFLFACLMFFCSRRRIPFAHAVLHASALSLKRYNGPIYFTYFLGFVSLGWFLLWGFTFLAVLAQGSGENGLTGGQQFILLYVLFSSYWTQQVLTNVGATTTAGAVATFYFQPQTESATLPALKRTMTTSFGSVCLGSLIVAVLETLRGIFSALRQKNSSDRDGNLVMCCIACVAECIVTQLEKIMRYVNSYAYCHVAIYGSKFFDAAKATVDLFEAHLFTALINDNLTGAVVFFGSLTGGGAACIVAIIWGFYIDIGVWFLLVIVAFFVGFGVSILFFSAVTSAVRTTFVCWATDPLTIQNNHPQLYHNLMKAHTAAGYNVQINVNARAGQV